MKFSITFNNQDCSGEPWVEEFDVRYIETIDDANKYATILQRVRNAYSQSRNAYSQSRNLKLVRVLTVTMLAPVIRLRDVLASLWED